MQPKLYTVERAGKLATLYAMSLIGAVAAISHAPRHNWQYLPNGDLEVTARQGNGVELDKYKVFSTFHPRESLQ